MSRLTTLGDAVVVSLNDTNFSQDFTATRRYRPIIELKDLADLTVTVIVPSIVQNITARKINTDDMVVDVLVQKQADPESNTVMDALLNLCEEIGEHFRGLNFGSAYWRSTEILSTYYMEDLYNYRMFSALVSVNYRGAWRQ